MTKVENCWYPSSMMNSHFKKSNYVLSLYWGMNAFVRHCILSILGICLQASNFVWNKIMKFLGLWILVREFQGYLVIYFSFRLKCKKHCKSNFYISLEEWNAVEIVFCCMMTWVQSEAEFVTSILLFIFKCLVVNNQWISGYGR